MGIKIRVFGANIFLGNRLLQIKKKLKETDILDREKHREGNIKADF